MFRNEYTIFNIEIEHVEDLKFFNSPLQFNFSFLCLKNVTNFKKKKKNIL